MDDALTKVADDCIAACPTAALSFAEKKRPPVLVQLEPSYNSGQPTNAER